MTGAGRFLILSTAVLALFAAGCVQSKGQAVPSAPAEPVAAAPTTQPALDAPPVARVTFRHDGSVDLTAGRNERVYLDSARGRPLTIQPLVTPLQPERLDDVRIVIRLLDRSAPDEPIDLQILNGVDLSRAALAVRPFRVSPDKPGQFALDVQILQEEQMLHREQLDILVATGTNPKEP